MFVIIWKYQANTENITEFETAYSAQGTWAQLFKKGLGYLGTEFLQDEANLTQYLTIDRWQTKEDFEAFQLQWQEEYKSLDSQCEGLTEQEFLLGKWNLK